MIPLLAATAALAFAPPLDRPLRYETTERRARGDGTMRGAILSQEVVFTADGGGYVMTIRTTGCRNLLPAAKGDGLDAVMKPMVGGVIRVRLSSGGVPLKIIDGAATWSAMLTSLRASIAARPANDPAAVPARAMLAALEATPPEAREARLIAGTDELLATRLPPIAIGEKSGDSHVSVSRDADAGNDARYREHSVRDAGGRTLRTDADVAVSRKTGLVTHSLRRTALLTPASETIVSETETALIL